MMRTARSSGAARGAAPTRTNFSSWRRILQARQRHSNYSTVAPAHELGQDPEIPEELLWGAQLRPLLGEDPSDDRSDRRRTEGGRDVNEM